MIRFVKSVLDLTNPVWYNRFDFLRRNYFDMSDLISTEEAGKILGFSRQWVAHLLRVGELKGQKIGANWAVLKSSVDKYKEESQKGDTEQNEDDSSGSPGG